MRECGPAPPALQDIEHFRYTLTAEAQGYLGVGSPEAQVFNAVPPEGITLADIKVGKLRSLWGGLTRGNWAAGCIGRAVLVRVRRQRAPATVPAFGLPVIGFCHSHHTMPHPPFCASVRCSCVCRCCCRSSWGRQAT